MSSRLQARDIAAEIRDLASTYSFATLTPARIPSGRDPRRLSKSDMFPQLIVQVSSALLLAKAVGGFMEGIVGLAMFVAFTYEDNEDLNDTKLRYAEEVIEFLCDNNRGAKFQMFISGSDDRVLAEIDYTPDEEARYRMDSANIALVKVSTSARQLEITRI